MRKMELISNICEQSGLSRYVVKLVVDATFEHITKTARAGETIVLPGFGRFQEIEGPDGMKRLRLFAAKKNLRPGEDLIAQTQETQEQREAS